MDTNKKAFDLLVYFAIIIFAVLFLLIGNRIAMLDFVNANERFGNVPAVAAEVTGIISEREFTDVLTVMFEATVLNSTDGERVTALQPDRSDGAKTVEVGDRVVVSRDWDVMRKQANIIDPFVFDAYFRIDKIMFFGGALVILLLLFCRKKGFNALLSLGLTTASIVAIFIPALLSGKNIYISAIIVCVFAILVTLFIVNGVNQKSLAAVAGCFGGVLSAGVLTAILNWLMGISGVLNFNSRQLLIFYNESPIDLKALVFAGIIIGAVGAIMDTAMSISSSLWELKTKAPSITFREIFQSGINIGRDLLGTMADTLVLAYVGNSLSFVLVHIVYSRSFQELLNKEIVIVELLNIITGSFGVLLSMPLTALVCALFYTKKLREIEQPV